MSQRLELVANGDNRVHSVYSESGALRLTPSDTSEPHGVYAKNGSYRVTLDPIPFDGVYAADGSYNLSIDSNGYVASNGILARLNGQFLGSVAEGVLPAVAFDGQNFVLPAYGPELVATGTFDASTGWNIGSFADWSISGGTLNKTGTTASGGPTYTLASQLEAGKLYRITYQVVSVTVGGVGVRTSGSLFSTLTNRVSVGTYEEYVTPISGVTGIQVVASAAGVTCVVDNLSVREVMLGELGTNLGASGYTMSAAGAATATESPTGQLNLAGDGANFGIGDKQLTGLTIGAHYRVVFLTASLACEVLVGTSQGGTQTVPVTTGSVGVGSIEFTATATTHWIRFRRFGVGTTTINNITIAQWTPRPTLRTASFNEVFAYTASSTTARTYVGSDGLIKNDLAADAPRWDFSNGRARLLLENQSTNSILRSAEFDNASWTKTFGSITSTTETAPDGTASGDLFIPDTSNQQHRVVQTFTGTAASAALSVFVKPSGYTKVAIRESSVTGSYSSFNLTGAGSVIENLTATGSITAWPGGWYRIVMVYTSAATTHGFSINVLDPSYTTGSPTTSWAANGTSGVILWGAQLELGQAFASSYIPTAAATVTRLIETARFSPLVEAILGPNCPGDTILVKASLLSPDTAARRVAGNSGAGDATYISTDSNNVLAANWNGSVNVFATAGSGGWREGGGSTLAWNSSGRSIALNGGAVASATSTVLSTAPAYLARNGTVGTQYADGYYNSFALWPFRVSNANLPALAVAPT
jgi:hypothetical protein